MAKLTHNVIIKAKDAASSVFKSVGQSVKKFQNNLHELTSIAANVIQIGRAMADAFKAVAGVVSKVVELSNEQIRVEKQLETVLKSTNEAAGLNADELKRMASELQAVTTFGDETIIGAQNLLLTFTKIGEDVFPQALETILDVATAMEGD